MLRTALEHGPNEADDEAIYEDYLKFGSPWMMSMRKWSWRFGMNAMPFPGWPQYMHVMHGQVWMKLLSVEVLMAAGIAGKELTASPDVVEKVLEASTHSVTVHQGETLFIPAGMIGLSVGAPPVEGERVACVYFPVLDVGALAASPVAVKTHVLKMTRAKVEAKKANQPWTAMHEQLEALTQAVEESVGSK